MGMKIDHMDATIAGIRKLIEKRDEYRQDIVSRTRRNAFDDNRMIEVDKVLLADIEWQLGGNKM